MGLEIERKYLVSGDAWRHCVIGAKSLRQGYVAIDGGNTLRVRTNGISAWITIKGPQEGIVRSEFEYEIPRTDAEELLQMCGQRIVEKTRHLVPHNGLVFEVDEFHGANEGLILAEIELRDEGAEVSLPAWVGGEVTEDSRYRNASLSVVPFRSWRSASQA